MTALMASIAVIAVRRSGMESLLMLWRTIIADMYGLNRPQCRGVLGHFRTDQQVPSHPPVQATSSESDPNHVLQQRDTSSTIGGISYAKSVRESRRAYVSQLRLSPRLLSSRRSCPAEQ
ncbi:MAG: hypothetical protein JWR32_281 [Mycobacterium sp.]|jgi:hypothetical protein|nr:hypothetical protein [Mycobacterium sp.]